ncbi:MAG: hypothetical protein GX750_08430 [Clostridia bacterium]|nr:hypothetical protein [Clostridia bacterium]
MKLIGALLILSASTAMGILAGRRLAARPRQLQRLRNDLMYLETEINYGATPLPEALGKLVKYSQWPVTVLWQETLSSLANGEGLMAEEAWRHGIHSFAEKADLTKTDLAVLRDFGTGLGMTNRHEQLKKFKFIQEQLGSLHSQAEVLRARHERMWRTMGILGGIALIILLY